MNPIWKKRITAPAYGTQEDEQSPLLPKSLADVEFRQTLSILIPSFEFDNVIWFGASRLLGQININLPGGFSILDHSKIVPNNSYVLCVRYRVGGAVVRYKLWEGVNELLFAPLYVGQSIKANCTFEVWSVNNATTPVDAYLAVSGLTGASGPYGGTWVYNGTRWIGPYNNTYIQANPDPIPYWWMYINGVLAYVINGNTGSPWNGVWTGASGSFTDTVTTIRRSEGNNINTESYLLRTGIFDYTIDDEAFLPQQLNNLERTGEFCADISAPIPSSVGFPVGECSQGVNNT